MAVAIHTAPIRRKPDLGFRSKQSSKEETPDTRSTLVELLIGADELERKRLLLMALQSGEVKRSEVADLLRLVERLESVSR